MFQKKWALLTLSSLSLFMAACEDGENLEELQEATTELDRIKEETVNDVNQLVETENQLQGQFTETMENDQDLTTFADGTSPVFDNIESRISLLTALEEKEEELLPYQETLTAYEGELVDQQTIDHVIESVDTFSDHLTEFRSTYSNTLDSQDSYFTSLATDEASYDDFVNGIEALNEERDSLHGELAELDSVIVELDENLETLTTTLDELLTEEE